MNTQAYKPRKQEFSQKQKYRISLRFSFFSSFHEKNNPFTSKEKEKVFEMNQNETRLFFVIVIIIINYRDQKESTTIEQRTYLTTLW